MTDIFFLLDWFCYGLKVFLFKSSSANNVSIILLRSSEDMGESTVRRLEGESRCHLRNDASSGLTKGRKNKVARVQSGS